jgi:hypothetical protein
MDGHQFDDLLRAALTSRRSVLGLVLAAGAAITSRDLTEARKKKPCPPCKVRKKGKCKGTLPDGTACAGGTCQGGSCVAPVIPPKVCSPACPPSQTCKDGTCVCPPGRNFCSINATCSTCCLHADCCGGQFPCPAGSPQCLPPANGNRVCGFP